MTSFTQHPESINTLITAFDVPKGIAAKGVTTIITWIHDNYKDKETLFSQCLLNLKFPSSKSSVRTIGIFYPRLYEGGVEKVISQQIPMFLRMGFKVVLFTEVIDTAREYPIPDSVMRVVLPRNYDKRPQAFAKALILNAVDLLILHSASSRNLVFDVILAKSYNIPVVVTRHELTSSPLFELKVKSVFNLPHVYLLCDALIVLSRMEETFYQNMGVNAIYVPNPIEPAPTVGDNNQEFVRDQDIVLWIGRLDAAVKNYRDALEIMKNLVNKRPNTLCYIVGGEFTRGSVSEVKRYIQRNNLSKSVFWYDHTLDVAPFYQKAKIHLVTSRMESFSMMIAESKAFGIPMVNFSLPYLELLGDQKGYVSIPQGDIDGATDAITEILDNPEKWKRLSDEALESIQTFTQFNLAEKWESIIQDIESFCGSRTFTEKCRLNLLFWETMMGHLSEGKKATSWRNKIISRLKEVTRRFI